MRRIIRFYCPTMVLVVTIASVVASTPASAQTPAWVLKRPVVEGYYVGIGSASTQAGESEFTAAARSGALNDIASQISVSLSSTVLQKVVETNDSLRSQLTAIVQTSARADLEDVELVGTFRDNEQYWVYLRIERSAYQQRRADKLRAAASLAADLLTRGRKAERQGQTTSALRSYAQSLVPLRQYLNEPLEGDVEGRRVYLANDAYASLQRLLDVIQIQPAKGNRLATIGRPLKPPYEVRVVGAGNMPVERLPVHFAFVRGAGDLLQETLSDQNGLARCEVKKITSPERIQVIEASVRLSSLLGPDSAGTLLPILLGTLAEPTSQLVLEVSGVEVYMEADETMFGEPLSQKVIEPALKSRLSDQGFSFVTARDRAVLSLNIKAQARKGSESYGLYFAFVTVDVTAIDLETGREIYRKSYADVKEGSDSYDKAARKAFSTAAARIAGEMVPQLVKAVQQ